VLTYDVVILFNVACRLLFQDMYGQSERIPEHHELSLSIITVLGLSLSILGLALTIISYLFFR